MIFATVGTQLPFDRMIKTFDKWNKKQRLKGCFAQIGCGTFEPDTMAYAAKLTPSQFAMKFAKCKVVLSHAGMGTILTAGRLGKPIIILPRQARFHEHRNDHQLATTEKMQGRPGLYIAHDETDLLGLLDSWQNLKAGRHDKDASDPALFAAIRTFMSNKSESAHVH